MNSFVTHLESAIDGTRLPANQLQSMHKDRPLWVRYDLEAVGRALSKEILRQRPALLIPDSGRSAASGLRGYFQRKV